MTICFERLARIWRLMLVSVFCYFFIFITVRSPCLLITNTTELGRLVRRSRRRPNSSHIDRPLRRVLRRSECARAARTQARPRARTHRHAHTSTGESAPLALVRFWNLYDIIVPIYELTGASRKTGTRGVFFSSPPPPAWPFYKGWQIPTS